MSKLMIFRPRRAMQNTIHRLQKWLRDKVMGENYDEYLERFVMPHYSRGVDAGLSIAQLDAMWIEALQKSYDPTIGGLAPSSLFRDMVDNAIEQKQK